MKHPIKLTFILVLASISSMTSLKANAQEKLSKRHELYFGVGAGCTQLDHYMDKRTAQIPYDPDNYVDCGIDIGAVGLSLDYKYRLNKRFSTGISVGCNYNSDGYSDSVGKDGSIYEATFVYTMPTLTYTWYQTDNEWFRVYSAVGLGAAFLHEHMDVAEYQLRKNSLKLAYNATYAGISVGGQHVKFFSEFSAGCKNIFTLGMEVRL